MRGVGPRLGAVLAAVNNLSAKSVLRACPRLHKLGGLSHLPYRRPARSHQKPLPYNFCHTKPKTRLVSPRLLSQSHFTAQPLSTPPPHSCTLFLASIRPSRSFPAFFSSTFGRHRVRDPFITVAIDQHRAHTNRKTDLRQPPQSLQI
jgi:hypothetical protein